MISDCLNQGFHPFAEDYLGQSALDYAKQAPGANGTNIVNFIEQAQKQWTEQLSQLEILQRLPAKVNVSDHFESFKNEA